MKRMRSHFKATREGLPGAPRCATLVLGALIAVDAAHCVLQLHTEARTAANPRTGASPLAKSQRASNDPQQIVAAHLFGADPAAAHERAANAPETHLRLSLSGVIATSDPNEGYAILGDQGQATRLYRTGAAIANSATGRLFQVFADHVVLDFGGRRETLSLPRQPLSTGRAPRVARLETPPAPEAGIPLPISMREEAPTAAEGWFSNLYAERYTVAGRAGLRLHPAKHFQRRYGLRDGDTLTAVNGIPVGDEDAVDNILRAGGKTVALTLTHDGVEETVRLPVEQ
jgi:general secretion pathway protein C